ncbi:hypothetical protein OVA29_16190 [Exiguobacterium sp. SL14]|nr:hypothetical protein [Exiguobacterium sp. SL14]MCY1691978.1 hypothetical protein [Exiguobacterium sp. SL14]
MIEDRNVLKKKQRELKEEKQKRTALLKRLTSQKKKIESNILSLKEASAQLKAQEEAEKVAKTCGESKRKGDRRKSRKTIGGRQHLLARPAQKSSQKQKVNSSNLLKAPFRKEWVRKKRKQWLCVPQWYRLRRTTQLANRCVCKRDSHLSKFRWSLRQSRLYLS